MSSISELIHDLAMSYRYRGLKPEYLYIGEDTMLDWKRELYPHIRASEMDKTHEPGYFEGLKVCRVQEKRWLAVGVVLQ